MADDNRVRLPTGSAGITNYSDEYKSKIMMSPTAVLILIGIIVVFAILLRVFV